jgi:hypothetical protein
MVCRLRDDFFGGLENPLEHFVDIGIWQKYIRPQHLVQKEIL